MSDDDIDDRLDQGDDDYYDPNDDGVQIEPKDPEDEDDEYDEPESEPSVPVTQVVGPRMTDRIMTKFEYARLVSALATLYSAGLEVHPKVEAVARSRGVYDLLDLAEIHISFKDVPCPVNIERPMPNGTFEVWRREEMILPSELVTATDI